MPPEFFFDFGSQNGDLWCILGAIFCSSSKTLRGRKDPLAQVYFYWGQSPPSPPGIDATGHCDIQLWAWAAHVSAVPRSTQPSTLRGTVKRVSAFGLSNNNSGDGGCGR